MLAAGAAFSLLGLATCAVGPDFAPPTIPANAGYTPERTPAATASADVAGGATQKFDIGRDINGAARDVQAAINAAAGTLPSTLPYPPVYAKVNPADAPILTLALQSDGVTIDKVSRPTRIASALAALPERATTRVYFEPRQPASHYAPALEDIHAVSGVMGELLDSSDERSISTAAFQAHVEEYLASLSNDVDIWEVGNEVNGDWTGQVFELAP